MFPFWQQKGNRKDCWGPETEPNIILFHWMEASGSCPQTPVF